MAKVEATYTVEQPYRSLTILKEATKGGLVRLYKTALCWDTRMSRTKSYLYVKRLHTRLVQLAKEDIEPSTTYAPEQQTYYCGIVPTDGKPFKMLLARPGFVEDKIVRAKPWEAHLASIMSFFMRPGSVFIDIGANIGYHCFYIARSVESSSCICFEPHPILYTELLRNLRLNSDLSNICVHNLVIGDGTCETDFCMQTSASYNRGLSSVIPNADLRGGFETIRLQMVALDAFLDDATKDKVAVIKIDVQGYEAQVISGALETIARSKAIIVFEFEPNYHSGHAAAVFDGILTMLADYRVFLIKERSPEFFAEYDINKVTSPGFEGNFICFPKNVFEFKDLCLSVR